MLDQLQDVVAKFVQLALDLLLVLLQQLQVLAPLRLLLLLNRRQRPPGRS